MGKRKESRRFGRVYGDFNGSKPHTIQGDGFSVRATTEESEKGQTPCESKGPSCARFYPCECNPNAEQQMSPVPWLIKPAFCYKPSHK